MPTWAWILVGVVDGIIIIILIVWWAANDFGQKMK